MRDGTYENINYSFPIVNPLKNMPYIYKISSFNTSESSPFYLHVNIIKAMDMETVTDRRRVSKGIVCTSMNISDLHKFFDIDPKLYKKKYCMELMFSICEMQDKTEDKFMYTPFEA